MEKHVKAISRLHVAFGVLALLVAIALAVVLFVVSSAESITPEDQEFVNEIIIMVPLFAISGGIEVAAGIAIRKYRNWARIALFILSVLGLIAIPIGTLLGVYTIWVLAKAESPAKATGDAA